MASSAGPAALGDGMRQGIRQGPRQGMRQGGTAALSVMGMGAQQLGSLAITLLAAALLGAQDYGLYTLALVFAEAVVMLCYAGYFHYMIAADEDEAALSDTLFWVILAIGCAGGGAMILGAAALARLFEAPGLGAVLIWLGLVQPFGAAGAWFGARLMRQGRMRMHFTQLIAHNLGGLALGGTVLWLWPSIWALILYRAARAGLALGLYLACMPDRPHWRFDRALAWRATRYSGGIYGAAVMNFAAEFGTDLALAYLFSPMQAGLYRLANRMAVAGVDVMGQPLRAYAQRAFGACARAGQPLSESYARHAAAMVLLMGGVGGTLIVLGGPMMAVLFRPDYLAAVGALQALALRAALRPAHMLVVPVFAATGRTGLSMAHTTLWALVLFGCVLWVAPLGLTQLAWAQAGVQGACTLGALWLVARRGGVDPRPAWRRGGAAALLVLAHALALALGWRMLETLAMGAGLRLGLGIALALMLGALTCLAAIRLRVLDMALFSG